MQPERSQESPAQDRRVQRSRSALMGAAVRLVSERGTTAIAVTDLTEAADVSRKLLYLHFGDRDGLLVAAAIDLVRRELIPQTEVAIDELRGHVLVLARHFAGHRPFYRAMLTGSCAFAMTRTMNGLFSSLNRTAVRELFGELDQNTLHDLSLFVAVGAGAIVNDWLIDGGDSLDPEELADRLLRVGSAILPGAYVRVDGGRVR